VDIIHPFLIAFANNTETERTMTMRKINVNSKPVRAYAIISDPASFGLSNKQLMEKHGIRDSVFYAARRKYPEFKHQKPVVVREPKPRKRKPAVEPKPRKRTKLDKARELVADPSNNNLTNLQIAKLHGLSETSVANARREMKKALTQPQPEPAVVADLPAKPQYRQLVPVPPAPPIEPDTFEYANEFLAAVKDLPPIDRMNRIIDRILADAKLEDLAKKYRITHFTLQYHINKRYIETGNPLYKNAAPETGIATPPTPVKPVPHKDIMKKIGELVSLIADLN